MSYCCPNCKGIIKDRRVNVCTHCGAELPPISLFIPSEMKALDKTTGGMEIPVALLAQARVELRKARGHSEATRRAVIRYCRDGICSGFPSGLLLKWLFFWPSERESVFSQVGYSSQAGKKFIEMLKKLTVQEVLSSDDTTPAAVSALSPGSNMNADKVISEARARIIWGESSSSVRDFLISKSISGTIADTKIKEFSLERNTWIRKIGIRNVLIGVVITGAAGVVIYLITPYSGIVRALCVLSVVGIYALWKIVNGIIYLVRPQSEQKAIPDIAESSIE